MLRTHVSFESTPGAVIDSADAAALAPQLITALKQHGVAATPVRALDYAQEFELRYGGRTFYSMLGPRMTKIGSGSGSPTRRSARGPGLSDGATRASTRRSCRR